MKKVTREMTNKKIFNSIFFFVMIFGLVLSGCATDTSTKKWTNFEKRPMKWGRSGIPKYTVLGPVILEKDWYGILGFSLGIDFYIYQKGGVTYVDLLKEAMKKYPDVDAVIDINIDYSGSKYFIFYGARKNIVAGIAIKYSREEVDYAPDPERKWLFNFK